MLPATDGKAHVVENDVVVEGERYVFEGDRSLWPSWFSVYREHLAQDRPCVGNARSLACRRRVTEHAEPPYQT